MKTYTISKAEADTVSALVVAQADTTTLPSGEPLPSQPCQVRKLSAGWVGAEWVRYVADYQDSDSVGYASLGDLES